MRGGSVPWKDAISLSVRSPLGQKKPADRARRVLSSAIDIRRLFYCLICQAAEVFIDLPRPNAPHVNEALS